MVDPNRKINRLTDKDIEFLEECEQEFGFRYTDSDTEFAEYFAKPLGDPPIVDNWTSGGGGGDNGRRNDGGGRNYHNHGGNRQRGNWRDNRSGDKGQYNRNYRVRGSRGGGRVDYGGRRGDRNPYNYGQRDSRQDDANIPTRPPLNIRRDYGNFVAASKDE